MLAADVMAPRFGNPGQWVFTGEAGATAAYSHSPRLADESAAAVDLAPGVDLFVARHVTLGAAARISHVSRDADSEIEGGGGPRIGVDIPLGRSLSVYPRLLVSYARGTSETKTVYSVTRVSTTVFGSMLTGHSVLDFHTSGRIGSVLGALAVLAVMGFAGRSRATA